MTVERARIYVHTLSFPEHIWLNFWRGFFSQEHLLVDQDLRPISNNFLYDLSENEGNRFPIVMDFDFDDSKQNALPALVIEDTGIAQMGVSVDQLRHFEVSPEMLKERADLIRATYIFHCLSKDRGESRLLASMVGMAVTAYRDLLKRDGLNKIEPWSVGASVPMRADSAEDFVDTPVQVTFHYVEQIDIIERPGLGTLKSFCLIVQDQAAEYAVRASVDIADPVSVHMVRASVDIDDQNVTEMIRASVDVLDPTIDETMIRASVDVVDPTSAESMIRASVRIA